MCSIKLDQYHNCENWTHLFKTDTSWENSVQYWRNVCLSRLGKHSDSQRQFSSEVSSLIWYRPHTWSMITAALRRSWMYTFFTSPPFCWGMTFVTRNCLRIFLTYKSQPDRGSDWGGCAVKCFDWSQKRFSTYVVFIKLWSVPFLYFLFIYIRVPINLKELVQLGLKTFQVGLSPDTEKVKYGLQHYVPCDFSALNQLGFLFMPNDSLNCILKAFQRWWLGTNDVIILMPVTFSRKGKTWVLQCTVQKQHAISTKCKLQ